MMAFLLRSCTAAAKKVLCYIGIYFAGLITWNLGEAHRIACQMREKNRRPNRTGSDARTISKTRNTHDPE